MKILYYSTAYYSDHGGKHHARAFVEHSARLPNVESVRVFPELAVSKQGVTGGGIGGMVKSIIAANDIFLPLRLRRRNKIYLNDLRKAILDYSPGAIVVRLDNNYQQLYTIREEFPEIALATEINASPFQESYKNIPFKKYFQRQEREALSVSDLNFFVSDFLRKSIMGEAIDSHRDRVNQNGVDVEEFRPMDDTPELRARFGLPADQRIVLYVGSLAFNKRVDILLSAFGIVREEFGDAHLFVVGGGEATATLTEYAQANLPAGSYTFAGQLDHDQIPSCLAVSEVAVHHFALDYMSPLKVFEYLACRVPTIAPDTPAVREVLKDNVHALFTTPHKEAVAQRISRLLGDAGERRRLGENGYDLITSTYTWKVNAENVVLGVENVQRK